MSSPPTPQHLTTHLLHLTPSALTHATQTPFLQHAGAGTLPKPILQSWLTQDRLYAQSYIRFGARLLATLPPHLPMQVNAENFYERALELVLAAIGNVRKELEFFERVGRDFDLDVAAREVGKGVTAYKTLFEEGGGWCEGGEVEGLLLSMVLLWGTEKCYLDAWRYAASFSDSASKTDPRDDADGGALRMEFIPNWTSGEFAEFVDKIQGLVEELWGMCWKEEGVRKKVEGLWERILEVEKMFWPVVEG